MNCRLQMSFRWVVLCCCCLTLWACQANQFIDSSTAYRYKQPSQDGIGKVYMGREIAQVMGYEGAYWLERPSRELQEHPQRVVDLLDLDLDAIVADIGAGSGYMAQRLAQAVPSGKVLAVDVQPEMIDLLNQRITEETLTVVKPVLGTTADPQLPPESIDLALMVDAYHEFEYPREMLEHLWIALRPGGQVVLAEYRAENPLVMIKRLHKMSEAQVKRELATVGFEWLKTEESLPQQHLLFFTKPAAAPSPTA
ncbi:class I SAM-dependent methyltransferase [Halomicronema sp. CCY15110]|uniref:class I SAM-dependent methyltransferase n=1 Tax=Halomicronema sp. CCY15110 TaxID=2767773 RepID=UPI001EF34B59|nr:class I SAM-dependent methyltransferase [Halomicronema sp. CCY15110]